MMNTAGSLDFVPALRSDISLRSYGQEAVALSPLSTGSIYLDPVATVMLQIVDGHASVGDLVEDITDVLELDRPAALKQVSRAIELFDWTGLLKTSTPVEALLDDHELFRDPPNN